MNRKRFIMALLLVAALGSTIFLILHNSSQSTKSRSASLSEAGPVTLQDKANLSDILLNQQYNDFSFAISDFIHQKISPSINLATIQTAMVKPSGLVEAQIETDSSRQIVFTVSIDRSQYNQLTISIASYKYVKVVQVY